MGGAMLAGCSSLLAPGGYGCGRVSISTGSSGRQVLLIVALLTYQPAAMFFWVFFAVALVGSVDDTGRALRLVRVHFARCGRCGGWSRFSATGSASGSLERTPQGPIAARSRTTSAARRNVLGLGSLRRAEPLRRDVDGLAGCVRRLGGRAGHRALGRCGTQPGRGSTSASRRSSSPITVLPNLVVEETYQFEGVPERWCRSRR